MCESPRRRGAFIDLGRGCAGFSERFWVGMERIMLIDLGGCVPGGAVVLRNACALVLNFEARLIVRIKFAYQRILG